MVILSRCVAPPIKCQQVSLVWAINICIFTIGDDHLEYLLKTFDTIFQPRLSGQHTFENEKSSNESHSYRMNIVLNSMVRGAVLLIKFNM